MQKRVENLGTGTKGIPRLLEKGASSEVELVGDGNCWLIIVVKRKFLFKPQASGVAIFFVKKTNRQAGRLV